MFVLEKEQVEAHARRAAGWLASQGLRAGDRVAVLMPNAPAYLPLTMGALRTGIVPVPVNVHLAAAERERIIADAQVSLVIEGQTWEDAPGAELAPYPLARPMHYTSGTTGFAKGVWSGPLSEADAEALVLDERELWAPRLGDTYLVCSPLYHSAPLRIATSALLAGARVLVFERFDAAGIARAFVDERVSGAFLVPTHLRRLLEIDGFAPRHARRILHAGEPCPEPIKRRAIDAFGTESLHEFYGSTEGQFTFCTSEQWLERPGTVGQARPGRELSIDNAGSDGVGVIYVTAPPFARWQYWGDPEKTASAWRDVPIRGGRYAASFTVGDLGRLDADGYLFLEGRREDLIISGGVNVYTAEVERVLLEHPGVGEAAVFGVPDDEFGQRVCAAVTGTATPEAIRAFARDRLPGSHTPKDVYVVETLPRTQTGKIKRSALAVRFLES